MENKKKIELLKKLKKSLLITGLLTTGALTVTGCSNSEKTEEVSYVSQDELVKELQGDVKAGETKTFEPGEHYILVRVPEKNPYDNDDIPGYAINNMPEGYSVYSISPFSEKLGYGSATGGHDIWFVNDETVEVTATYNECYKAYGFYTFGEVVNEKTK